MRTRAKSGFLASASPESHFFYASKRFNRARQEEPSLRFPALMDTFDAILHAFARFCYTRNCRRVFVLPHFPLAFAHFHMLIHALMHVKMLTRPLFLPTSTLSFANWMAVVIAPYIVFVLMLDLLHFVFRSRVACLWIGPRLALAARCG